MNRVSPTSTLRLLPCRPEVRGGGVDGHRVGDAALQQPKCQPADSRTDIKQRPVQHSGAGNALLQQACRPSWTLRPVTLQFAGGLLLVELLIRRVFERRATG